ncbi:MAG TPA: hypothetical protein VM533_05700 [Fimbriiglobus sp.]|nr:hypothetical protein [Fimbriiglobus sp.]
MHQLLRRFTLLVRLSSVVALAFYLTPTADGADPTRQPNIVFIFSDDVS